MDFPEDRFISIRTELNDFWRTLRVLALRFLCKQLSSEDVITFIDQQSDFFVS
jgi:hypothetical protein